MINFAAEEKFSPENFSYKPINSQLEFSHRRCDGTSLNQSTATSLPKNIFYPRETSCRRLVIYARSA